ncbi:VCBS repeat-containing protein [Streptomyces sp. NPDC047974]|uniref:VCBS repeat-containing protein n=1 Tax=Streptomyces sp. NPDC047974 TaxID=3154343 RepID=UPI0033DD1C98
MTATTAALLGALLAPQGAAALTAEEAVLTQSAPPPQQPEEEAGRQARETGERVEVLALRTETSQVFADPSGTFTQEQYVLPRWTRKDHKLVPIDTNLSPGPDGRLAPGATTTGVSFSGGGSGPAVTIEQDGRSIALNWPTPLPAPETVGDTATYREVLPDVDLQLRAGNKGFGQLLVVKTPEAAANPALKTIRMAMVTNGLDVAADTDGNLTAVNPAGQEVFTAPTPRMWDSSTAASQARTLAGDTSVPPSDPFEPGYGAKEAQIDLTVTDDALTLQPNQQLLADQDTTYPVFIDPTFSAPGVREAWALAYKRTPNTAYYNGAGWHNEDGSVGTNLARVGYENYTNGLGRSFFRMDSNNLWNTNKYIKGSTFRIKNVWSWSCENRGVELWLTGAISSSTTWNNTDNSTMWARKLDSANESHGYSGCAAANIAFDTTSAAKEAVTKKWNNITIGLRATNESDVFAWKKFDAGTAMMTTTYNTYPKLPSNIWTSPDTNAPECIAGPYMNATIGNVDVTLAATVSDPDGGIVKARFSLWPTGHGASSIEAVRTVEVSSGKSARTVISNDDLKKMQAAAGMSPDDTTSFSWQVRAEDGELTGPWTTVCSFSFDAKGPDSAPSVTSDQFPDGADGWPEQTGMARTTGSFRFTMTEVVSAFEYWTDWDPTIRKITLPLGGGLYSGVSLTPPSVGRHAVTVRALDAGGNLSLTARYWFYANGTGIPDKPGDLNGDGLADFYGVRSDGELWFYAGHGTGVMAPAVVASNQDFSGADITRRGDWTQDGYEDLIALNGATDGKSLTLHPNNGFGHACSKQYEAADGVSKACQYNKETLFVFDSANNHWSNADQILAVGDVDGPLDTDADGTFDVPAHPDLLVKQGNLLWLYYGSADHSLDGSRQPKLIGTSGWGPYTLAAPGDHNKDGYLDLIARHNTTGELRLYSGGKDGATLGSGDHYTVIGSAWTATNRPLLTAVPDANKDGTPDMWATSADGKLYFYPNALGSGTVVGLGGWTPFRDLT